MRSLLTQWLFAVAATVSMALPASAQPADASLRNYVGPDRMDRIVAAAKKEGSLTWYTSITQKDSAKIIQRFEDEYGIKVTVWRSGDDNVLQRLIAESKGQIHKADLAQIQIQNMEALAREKLLVPVNSPAFNDLVPGAVSKHKEWAVAQITLFVLAYNTNLIKKEDLPKSYRDLLDPKWKGKLGVEATDYDWLHIVAEHLGGDAGIKLLREIKEKNGFSVRTGHSLLANLVAAGEVPLALNAYQYKTVQLKRGGAPIDWFTLEPTLAYATGIGILRHAKHPNAALLFYEFMLKDGQEVMASIDNVPSNKTVKSPLKSDNIRFIDPDSALDNRSKREDMFNQVFVDK